MPIIAPLTQFGYDRYKGKPFEYNPLAFGSKINKVYKKTEKFYKTEDPEAVFDAVGLGVEILTGLPYNNAKKIYTTYAGEEEIDDFRNYLMFSRYKTNRFLESTEDIEKKIKKMRAKKAKETRKKTKAVKERRERGKLKLLH
jgi:hypothetical protein